jgi:4a-hydroxytetrahydrobiopterin dehydratase
MTELTQMNCVPCRGGIPPLSPDEIHDLLPQVPNWQVVDHDGVPHLVRTFKVQNFTAALELANRIGAIANQQDHHPTLLVEYRQVTVSWWTHAIHGLHQNDFIMAARTDKLYDN